MKIRIDDTEIDVDQHYRRQGHAMLPENPTMSGAQIAAAVGKDATYEVWLRRAPPLLNLFVPMTEPVILRDGMRFSVTPQFIHSREETRPEDNFAPGYVYRYERFSSEVSDDSSIRNAFQGGLKTEEKK